MQICAPGQVALEMMTGKKIEQEQPCPLLREATGPEPKTAQFCKLVDMEQRTGGEKLIQKMLAVGIGCTMPDEDMDEDEYLEIQSRKYKETKARYGE